MNTWYRYCGIFLLLVAALVLQQSLGVLRVLEDGQPGSGFLPCILGITLAVLSAMLIVKHRGRDGAHRPFWEGRAWAQPLLAVVITAVFIVVFDDVGAITSVAVLVAGWLWLVSKKPVPVAVATGALTAAAVYVVFERLLDTPFPRGLLF